MPHRTTLALAMLVKKNHSLVVLVSPSYIEELDFLLFVALFVQSSIGFQCYPLDPLSGIVNIQEVGMLIIFIKGRIT